MIKKFFQPVSTFVISFILFARRIREFAVAINNCWLPFAQSSLKSKSQNFDHSNFLQCRWKSLRTLSAQVTVPNIYLSSHLLIKNKHGNIHEESFHVKALMENSVLCQQKAQKTQIFPPSIRARGCWRERLMQRKIKKKIKRKTKELWKVIPM